LVEINIYLITGGDKYLRYHVKYLFTLRSIFYIILLIIVNRFIIKLLTELFNKLKYKTEQYEDTSYVVKKICIYEYKECERIWSMYCWENNA